MNDNGSDHFDAAVQIGATLVLRLQRLLTLLRDPSADERDVADLAQKIETSAGLYAVALSEVMAEVKRVRAQKKRPRGVRSTKKER